MSKKLPNFEDLAKYYPAKGSAAEVKSAIGGSVDQEHLHNTCIMRISKSLNYTGHPIPHDTGWFRTKLGADKKWYGLRVTEFWDYLLKHYGRPTVHKRREGNRIAVAPFSGIRGIIGFRVGGLTTRPAILHYGMALTCSMAVRITITSASPAKQHSGKPGQRDSRARRFDN